MQRGGGDEDVKGGTEIFSGIKGGLLEVLDILKGGGGYKLFKVLVQQGPGVFTPAIVIRIDGLETQTREFLEIKVIISSQGLQIVRDVVTGCVGGGCNPSPLW